MNAKWGLVVQKTWCECQILNENYPVIVGSLVIQRPGGDGFRFGGHFRSFSQQGAGD